MQAKVPNYTRVIQGLAVPNVGNNAVYMAEGLIDDLVTVCEESIALAILRLIEVQKAVVEGAGAVGLAALISGKLDYLREKRFMEENLLKLYWKCLEL